MVEQHPAELCETILFEGLREVLPGQSEPNLLPLEALFLAALASLEVNICPNQSILSNKRDVV